MVKYEDLILRIPDIVSEEECRLLIDYHESLDVYSYVTESSINSNTGKGEAATFKCVNLFPYSEEHNLVHSKTKQMVLEWREYLKGFGSFSIPILNDVLNYAHMYRLLKYETGAKIHPHTDFSPYIFASCTLNLNDDYAGGDLCFWNRQHTLKLKKGEGVIFPADLFWVHEVTPVESGERYSTNCFIGSMDTELVDEVDSYAKEEAGLRMKNSEHSQYAKYLWGND